MGAVQSARAQELSANPRQGRGLVQEKVGGKAPFVCLLTVDVYFFRIHEKYETVQETIQELLQEKRPEKEKEKFKGKEYVY